MIFKKLILGIFLSILFNIPVFAYTIINVPLDSRPVSTDYLQRLTEIGNDEYISVSKESLDLFTAYDELNHFGNSPAVRDELEEIVSVHNDPNTTVIISTSCYITGGLVGSRCGVNYADYTQALEQLKNMIQTYSQPHYCINIVVPRALPETRAGAIWPDNNSYHGIGYFYLQYYPNCEDKATIQEKYANITPIQLLMEYSYTENKSLEAGYSSLTPWEKDFLSYFKNNFLSEKYLPYVENYKLPYKATTEIFSELLNMQDYNIDIIVGNDDLTIPESIAYFNQSGADWIPKSKESPIKYSFARSYMQIYPNSIQNILTARYGITEKCLAVNGLGKNINIIHGTDELPQLIYAREYAKRHNLTTNFTLRYNDITKNVTPQDVIRPNEITRAAINFTKGSVGRYTDKPFAMFIYDYHSERYYSTEGLLKDMYAAHKSGFNVGLIELFDIYTTNSVYKKLIYNSDSSRVNNMSTGIWQLNTYSAWNTNANAIGLGIAQAQVYSIASQVSSDLMSTEKAQIKMLFQHLLEDGEYTKHGKRELVNAGFKPANSDNSTDLYNTLNVEQVTEAFKDTVYTIDGEEFTLTDIDLKVFSFPWVRTFDCYIDSEPVFERTYK